MTIDRRKLLSSLAAATFGASVASTINAANATARRGAIREGESCGGWLLARESRPHRPDHAVDFWARPYCDIAYAEYLPPEIARGTMWYEAFDWTNRPTHEAIRQSFQHHGFDRKDRPRRYAAHLDGSETLASTLRPLIEHEVSNSTARTAFLALDSQGPWKEPDWADVLPAFRSCYDRIIGHFHVPQRGLRQWRKFLSGPFGEEHFQQDFVNAAAQCDAVIITSAALAESDLRCSPSASTEDLVGKLMRDLGCALLTPAVLDRIVGGRKQGTARKPRFFALASLALETMDDYYMHSALMLGRQYEIVRFSFGADIADERRLLVATVVEDIHSDMVAKFRRATGGPFFTAATPAYEIEKLDCPYLKPLHMITLWPFEFDEDKLSSL